MSLEDLRTETDRMRTKRMRDLQREHERHLRRNQPREIGALERLGPWLLIGLAVVALVVVLLFG